MRYTPKILRPFGIIFQANPCSMRGKWIILKIGASENVLEIIVSLAQLLQAFDTPIFLHKKTSPVRYCMEMLIFLPILWIIYSFIYAKIFSAPSFHVRNYNCSSMYHPSYPIWRSWPSRGPSCSNRLSFCKVYPSWKFSRGLWLIIFAEMTQSFADVRATLTSNNEKTIIRYFVCIDERKVSNHHESPGIKVSRCMFSSLIFSVFVFDSLFLLPAH